jgi:hypothetical protein
MAETGVGHPDPEDPDLRVDQGLGRVQYILCFTAVKIRGYWHIYLVSILHSPPTLAP